MPIRTWPAAFCILALVLARFALNASAAQSVQPTRDIKLISSAGARALVDACSAWAEKNK